MINAEKLVLMLARKKVISRELKEGLLERIAQSPAPLPADVFAQRLVDRGIITQMISENILRILNEGENAAAATPTAAPTSPPKKQGGLLKPPKLPTQSPPRPKQETPLADPFADFGSELDAELPPLPENADEAFGLPSRSSSKRGKFKKGKANPWDSKLLLYGGVGILVMILSCILLYYAIYRRGADEYLSAANAARESGNYHEAIKEYGDYLKYFPNHSGVPEATVLLSLSKMRLITDSKNDWPGALIVAKEEIAKILQQPDYRKEAEPEFTAMLPTIAENLALGAKEKKDEKLLADAEEAMRLIEKHVPVSSQPVGRLQEARKNINYTKEALAIDDHLATAVGEVGTLLQNEDISGAYKVMDDLRDKYGSIENDSRFTEILRSICGGEKRAVKFYGADAAVQAKTNASGPDHSEEARSVVVLANRKVFKPDTTQTPRTLFVYASGSVFAVRNTDGTILWKKTVGGSLLTTDRAPAVIPLPLSNDKEDVLLVDYRTWEILRLDSVSGELRFRLTLGEPFRLAELTPNKVVSTLYLTTESGKCFQIDLESGRIVGGLQFPQQMNVAPLVDETNNRLLQLAHRSTLFLCPCPFDGGTPQAGSIESLYLGHQPGAIRTAPFLFGPYLLIAQKNATNGTTLQVYEIVKSADGAETGTVLKSVQSIPLQGAVETAPVVDKKRLFLASDAGIVYLFQLEDDPAAKTPLKLLAEGAPEDKGAGKAEQREVPRYLGLFGSNLWVSGQELIAYEIQASRNRLTPLRITDPLTSTTAPLRRIENTVYRTFQYKGQSGTAVKAFALEDGAPLWETQLADPLVAEPTYDSTAKTVRAVTQSGKLYQFSLSDSGRITILDKPVADRENEKRGEPIQALVPLTGGFEAWIERESIGKAIPIYDSSPSNPLQFRSIPISSQIQATPIALGNGLLVPFANGQVFFYNPKTGKPICEEPFADRLSPSVASRWSAPLMLLPDKTQASNRPEFLILDEGQSVLYRVGVESEGKKYRFRTVSKLGEIPLQSNVVLGMGGTAYVFSQSNGIVQEVPLEKMRPGRLFELGNKITWGPYAVVGKDAPQIVLATSDRRLHLISANDSDVGTKIRQIEIPDVFPQGKPLFHENRLVFNSYEGSLYQVDPTANTATALRETDVSTLLGPVFFDERLCTTGEDGCLYVFPLRGDVVK